MSNSLVSFYFKNVYSYYEEAFFSMEVIKQEHKNNTANVFKRQGVSLLSSAGIFGQGSSGKTNLLKSLKLLQQFVLQGETGNLNYDLDDVEDNNNSKKVYKNVPFNQEEDSVYEVEFLTEKNHFIYHLELNKQSEVKEETLYIIRSNNRKTVLYTRNETFECRFYGSSKVFNLCGLNPRLLLFGLSLDGWKNLKHKNETREYMNEVVGWFRSLIFVFSPNYLIARNTYFEHPEYLDIATEFLDPYYKKFNGIYLPRSVSPQTPNRFSGVKNLYIKTEDYGALGTSQDLYLTYEINGQKKEVQVDESNEFISPSIFKEICLLPQILDALNCGDVILIDNLDIYLDEKVVKQLIWWFNTYLNRDRYAQLIATFTSSLFIGTGFMANNDSFHRDQIWFVNKDNSGSSRLVSLAEFKKEKNRHHPYYEQYLAGFFEIR